MEQSNLWTNQSDLRFYIILFIISVLLIIGIGIFVIKWFDYKIKISSGGRYLKKVDSKVVFEASHHEIQIKSIKDIINQTIRQRSLISRIKMEIQSFEDMIKLKKTFRESDFSIIHELLNDLDDQIEKLNEFSDKKQSNCSDFLKDIIEQEQKILLRIRLSTDDYIKTSLLSSDYEKFTEQVNKIEFNYQIIVKLYQILTSHVRQQLDEENITE